MGNIWDFPNALHALFSQQIQIIYRAAHYEKVTNGFFNPAIGALIEAWGFHTDEVVEKIPNDAMIGKIINSHPSLKQLNISNELSILSQKCSAKSTA